MLAQGVEMMRLPALADSPVSQLDSELRIAQAVWESGYALSLEGG